MRYEKETTWRIRIYEREGTAQKSKEKEMSFEKEDFIQEYELIRAELHESPLVFHKRQMASMVKSKKWNYFYANRGERVKLSEIEHIPIEQIDHEEIIDLHIAIERLEDWLRIVVSLTLEGLSQENIAKMLGIDRSSVSKRYRKAIKEMRKYYGV